MTVVEKVGKRDARSDGGLLPKGEKAGDRDRSSKDEVEEDALESFFINLTLSSESSTPVGHHASVSKKVEGSSISKADDANDKKPLLPASSLTHSQTPSSSSRVAPRKDGKATIPAAPVGSFLIKGIPAFLQHPFRLYKKNVLLDSMDRPVQPFSTVTSGTSVEYFARLRNQVVRFSKEDKSKKLLVLSLNGDLGVKVARGEFLPRPFLGSLMEYITHPRHADSSNNLSRAVYSVFIWSAMVPHNVQPCINALIRPWKSSITGVWDRTQLDLDEEQYWENPPVWKDLDKLFAYFKMNNAKAYRPPAAAAIRLLNFTPNLDNTIMVEESAFKAHLQPWNHLPIKEYKKVNKETSSEASYQHDRRARVIVGEDREIGKLASLLEAIFQHDSLEFYRKYVDNPPNQYHSKASMGLDGSLLGIIGILFEMENVDSVPVWIAAGGLTPDVTRTFTKDIASKGWKYVVRLDKGGDALLDISTLKAHVLPKAALPGSEGYICWYDSPLHLLYWIRRGLRALELKGIKIEHGMR